MIKTDEYQKQKFTKKYGLDLKEIDKNKFQVLGSRSTESEHLSSKPYSYLKTVGMMLLKSPTFMISLILIIFMMIGMFAFAPIGMDYVPVTGRPGIGPMAPNSTYLFGLGLDGEDYFPRIWGGLRTTLLFSLGLVLIQLVLGILIGSIWGYFRRFDIFFIQMISIIMMIPSLVLILFVMFLFNEKNFWVALLAISFQVWVGMATMIRIQVMLVKNTDYNTASIFMGSSSRQIITRNIMPRILPIIAQTAAMSIPAGISFDSSLTYLGFGFVNNNDTTQASLGQVLTRVLEGTDYQVYPHLLIFPVMMIVIISVLFFLVGRIFADSLNPKSHR